MNQSFLLPDLGEGIHEGEITAVLVKAGDQVTEGDIVFEAETDKAAVEIPSPFTGTVVEVNVKPGDLVPTGAVLMIVEIVETETVTESPESVLPGSAKAADSRATAPVAAVHPAGRPVPASPATRRLARELGVDLRKVTPTGRGGVVLADDVRQFRENGNEETAAASAPAPTAAAGDGIPASPAAASSSEDGAGVRPSAGWSPLPDFSRWGDIRREPARSVRRATARHLAEAWARIPHVSSQDNLDVTGLEAFRKRRGETIRSEGGRLTLTVLALKAAAAALRRHPRFNGSYDEEREEMILKEYIHIGVAADTPDGLIVPVIRDVDRKSLHDLALELPDLLERTRNRKIAPEEMQGGTFTITNMGAADIGSPGIGGGHFVPLINWPQVAIMGLGRAAMQPVVRNAESGDPEIVPRLVLPVVVTFDHRMLDGADASRFMADFRRCMEDPEDMLMRI